MRLGPIQRDIIAYLERFDAPGAYIGSGCRAPEFQGYDLEQVEAALDRLERRRIVRREGVRYVLISDK